MIGFVFFFGENLQKFEGFFSVGGGLRLPWRFRVDTQVGKGKKVGKNGIFRKAKLRCFSAKYLSQVAVNYRKIQNR